MKEWHSKPYYSLDAYCKDTFGHKCYKISLNAHMTCPNRDGSLGTKGCIFCSAGGSGDFATSINGKNISQQLEEGKAKFRGKKTGEHFIAYFQAYTNTYAPLEYLDKVYRQAMDSKEVCGISIATRPDCFSDGIYELILRLKMEYPDKFIWIELGLQTIHEKTALFIRRGYDLKCFEETFLKLAGLNIPTIIHVILGLPGEDTKMMLETISYINQIHPFGVKLQLLHVLKDTDLADYYLSGEFETLSQNDYLELVAKCLSLLSEDIVIHRVTGDGPKSILLAPDWSGNKRNVLNSLHKLMRDNNIYQGCAL